MAPKILGARPHQPREQKTYDGQPYWELPISLWLESPNTFDKGEEPCNICFMRHRGEYYFTSFEVRTGKVETLETYAKFFAEWEKFCNDNDFYRKNINHFLDFLKFKKIPLIHWWDGMFYNSPDTTCFNWYYDDRLQGRLFADNQIEALKRIKKQIKYTPESMKKVRVVEISFNPTEHLKIPNWILNNEPEI
jgi:hypothetical protein